MNPLQGSFYSTAFRVRDERAFNADPAILEMQKRVDMFAGQRDGVTLHCISSKDTQPRAPLEVFAPAILGFLADARSGIVIEDSRRWIDTLQRHLHPDSGIVIDETAGNEKFMIYITADSAGWTREPERQIDKE